MLVIRSCPRSAKVAYSRAEWIGAQARARFTSGCASFAATVWALSLRSTSGPAVSSGRSRHRSACHTAFGHLLQGQGNSGINYLGVHSRRQHGIGEIKGGTFGPKAATIAVPTSGPGREKPLLDRVLLSQPEPVPVNHFVFFIPIIDAAIRARQADCAPSWWRTSATVVTSQ